MEQVKYSNVIDLFFFSLCNVISVVNLGGSGKRCITYKSMYICLESHLLELQLHVYVLVHAALVHSVYAEN